MTQNQVDVSTDRGEGVVVRDAVDEHQARSVEPRAVFFQREQRVFSARDRGVAQDLDREIDGAEFPAADGEQLAICVLGKLPGKVPGEACFAGASGAGDQENACRRGQKAARVVNDSVRCGVGQRSSGPGDNGVQERDRPGGRAGAQPATGDAAFAVEK
ncbi:hypothetical protein [Amycolatopsis vastitatis]|uniref:hypothetical protein n=1 Tax=Amycolatopsis vastitatis TaxID=1905142 RepID=UPI001177DB48|nr:hypothetical protein [Amycolatopsis vastitatis]